MNCPRLSYNFSRHPAFDFDLFRADRPETVNVSFTIHDNEPGTDSAGHFPGIVNCCRIALQIAAQPAFNQSVLAHHATTAKIPFAGKMHVTAGADAATEPAGDFVIAQVNVRAAGRTDCGCRCARNLLFAFTFETLDDRSGLPFPKILELSKDR